MPITRLVDGFYLFGTLKIYLKMVGGNIVAKIGGAYVGFSEFYKLKLDAELSKIDEM